MTEEAFQRIVAKGAFNGMTMPKGLVLSIDPGMSGGWAILSRDGNLIACGDLPVAGEGTQRTISAPLLSAVIDAFMPERAIVEQVWPRPDNGATQAFRYGRGVGIIDGVIGAAGLPVTWVPPNKWKRAMKLTSEKEVSRQRAIQRWPSKAGEFFARKKDEGRAEAALLGLYLIEAAV